MKEQLKSYVELLFAGTEGASEIQQEILQNTLDRYDDLVSQGKSPEAAYRLAITGIGDISEILNTNIQPVTDKPITSKESNPTPIWKKLLRAISVLLYIISPIPLFVVQNAAGLAGLLAIVAVATALIIIASGKETAKKSQEREYSNKENETVKAINSFIWTLSICGYFVLSFVTEAWYITWVIFLIAGAVEGLVKACIDLKEASNNEN